MSDVMVVGGGIVGAAIAFELAKGGAAVQLVERGPALGAEATGASAGMLGAFIEDHAGAAADAGRESRALWADFAARVSAAAGTDVRVDDCGSVRVAFDEPTLARASARAAAEPADIELLDAVSLAVLVPGVSPRALGGVFFRGDGVVDPPAVARALSLAIERAGGVVRPHARVVRVVERGGRAAGVELDGGSFLPADRVLVAAGAWTGALHPALPRTEPVRGQLLELVGPPLPRVVFGPGCYLSPRADGRLLVGSTMERVGFDRRVTVEGAARLLTEAVALLPSLAPYELRAVRAGLRPFVEASAEPVVGATALPGLLVATGHGRNGVLLAPLAARRAMDALARA